MKHTWLRLLSALLCTALLFTAAPAIATETGEAPATIAEAVPASEASVESETPSSAPAPEGSEPDAATGSGDGPAQQPDVGSGDDPAQQPDTGSGDDPAQQPDAGTGETGDAAEDSVVPAEHVASDLGISLEELALQLGISTDALRAMSAEELEAALQVLQGIRTTAEEFFVEGGRLVAYTGAGGDVTVPDGVSVIGEAAFRNCVTLTSVTLPSGVTEIEPNAFEGCAGLARIVLPETLRSIGPRAFKDCAALKAVALPRQLETIGEYAFQNCAKLEGIEIPESIRQLGGILRSDEQHIFLGCTSLKSASLPEGVSVLGRCMFSGCTALEELKLPSTLTAIESGALAGCTALQQLTIPVGVQTIASDAFAGCTQLAAVVSYGSAAEAHCKAAGISYTYSDAINSVRFVDASLTLGVGETFAPVVECAPAGIDPGLKFSSSNTRYVTVSADGVIQGKRAGSATITVKTYNGKTATLKVTVKKAPTSVSLSTTRTELGLRETAQLTAKLSSGSAGAYSFTSSDESKLVIDANGNATAIGVGDVTVTVTTYNGKSKSGVIHVLPEPESVTLSDHELRIGALDSWKLSYALNEGSAGAVGFTSSDPSVATVDDDGTVHALNEGVATITATAYNGVSDSCALTVVPAPTGVTLTAERSTIGLNEKLQLSAAMEPAGTLGTLKFSSSNTRYVTVSADGVIQGKRAGSATITVKTYNGKTATLKVTVKKAPTSVSLSTTRTELGLRETAQLTAKLSSGSAGAYSFTSSDESKLVIDANGNATAIGVGDVTVTVTTYNGKSKSGVIHVLPEPESVTLSDHELRIGALDSWKLSYALNEGSAGAVGFTSSDPSVATVDDDGTVHALNEGVATITATAYNGVSDSCALTVVPAPTGVTLTAERSTIGLNEKLQLSAAMEPAGTLGTLKFSSSNTRYVTVSADGVIQGKRAGSATITVKTYNGKTATLKVTVKKAPTSVSLSTTRTELGLRETAQLTAKLSSGSAGAYSFTSSDESKLVIDANGNATAIGVGDVTVTVTTYNGKSKSGVIHVLPEPESVTLSDHELRIGALDSWKLSYALNEGSAGAVGFTSSDPSVATVDDDGTVHALNEGVATITATAYNGVSDSCALTVVPAPTGVTLTAERSTIGLNEKLQLSAAMEPAGTLGTLKFSSSNTRYVTVSADGVIQGKRAGSATITVKTYNGKTATLKVTVKKAPTSVSLSTTRTELGLRETAQLTAKLSSGSAGAYSFTSSDESKLVIDANGNATAIGVGDVTVTVTTYNGKSKSGVIHVLPEPESVTLSDHELRIGALDSWKLSYALNEGSAGAVGFTSSDPSVATVDDDGTVHALNEGVATITATAYNGVSDSCALTVVPAPTGVTLTAERSTIGLNEKLQLSAAMEPAGTLGTLKFSSSNTRYVTVSADGVIQGKRAGSATITVKTYNGKTATLKVTVKKAPTSVSLSTTRTELGLRETAQLTAKLSSGSAGAYSFTSSDESKLVIDANGNATAIGVGDVTVTVTTYNGKSKSGVIHVLPEPESVTLSDHELRIGALDSWKLSYALNEGSAGAVGFTSSDPSVATVDDDGTVHALNEGVATITATAYNGVSDSCALTVVPAPTYVSLPYATLNIGLGDKVQLEPMVDPGSASGFRYSSSNTRYAKVSADGIVTAVKVGTATITIKTYNDLAFKLKVTVKKAPTSLKLSPASLVLGVGESQQLGHTIPSGTATTLTYLSADAEIASVNATGMVTGLALGGTTIQATTHNGKTAVCSVTVVPAPESISLDAVRVLGVGQTLQLNPMLLPEGSHSALRYEVISGDAVSVDESGLVTALRPGVATVRTSTYVEGVYFDHEIEVKPAPSSISFDATSYVVNVDDTLQLNPILQPEDCYTTLTYSIARAGLFTIDANGLVTPIMRGTTTVTVKTHNGLSATVTIQVVDPYFPESIAFAQTPPSFLNLGDTYLPVITVFPETAIAALQWSSSDAGIVSVDPETGEITALSYGRATITGTSTRNPALSLSYKLTVLSPDRCLKMPERRTAVGSISTTLSQIKNVRASAYLELESLYAQGIISSSDYNTRKNIVTRAFDMYLFPWMTNTTELYWRAANSENGAKDFKPGIVYYGLPYTQSNRTYNVSKVLSSGKFYDSGKGYYLMNGDAFTSRNYPGNDCSSFASMAIWGLGSSHSADTTRSIGSTTAYRTLTDPTDLRPGDLLNKSGSHVVMFLYYANTARTQMVIIEQGGGEAGTNTISCSIRDIASYTGGGYKIRRLASLD